MDAAQPEWTLAVRSQNRKVNTTVHSCETSWAWYRLALVVGGTHSYWGYAAPPWRHGRGVTL